MKKPKFLIIFVLMISFCLAASTQTFAQEEIMTNDEVISLVKAGLSSPIIVNKIRTSKTNFDLSTDALIKLKQANVGDDIVRWCVIDARLACQRRPERPEITA
jgi:hypothetical protein